MEKSLQLKEKRECAYVRVHLSVSLNHIYNLVSPSFEQEVDRNRLDRPAREEGQGSNTPQVSGLIASWEKVCVVVVGVVGGTSVNEHSVTDHLWMNLCHRCLPQRQQTK